MEKYSSVIILDKDYGIIDRRDFEGTDYLVMPIFAGYSQKYFKRNLFEETEYSYLDDLNKVMTPLDLTVKRLFDEELIAYDQVISALESLLSQYSLPKETYLRLTGYLTFIKNNPGVWVVQQNSNDYPDVDGKIQNNHYVK